MCQTLSFSENWKSCSGHKRCHFGIALLKCLLSLKDNFVSGFEKIQVALVLETLFEASTECQLVSIPLFSSMTLAEAWIIKLQICNMTTWQVAHYCHFSCTHFSVLLMSLYFILSLYIGKKDFIKEVWFVLLLGLCMVLVHCGPRPGQKCRSHLTCVLTSVQGIDSLWPETKRAEIRTTGCEHLLTVWW